MESLRLLMAITRTKAAKGPKGKADRLFSQLIRSRGVCVKCGEQEYAKLQTMHIVSRRYTATRVDETNALCGCWKCHRYFTDNPVEWSLFLENTIGLAEYLRLKDKALQGVRQKVDWDTEVLRLKALLEQVA